MGLCSPLLAQDAGKSVLPLGENQSPQWSRLEGTLESRANGITARARLAVQGPGQIRLDIERNDAARIAPQTIVASGDETRIFEPETKRIRRLPHNILSLRGWNLPFGGPANFLLANFADNLQLPPTGKHEHLNPQTAFVSDYVRFGGGGDRIFYVPFKRTIAVGAARVVLEWKAGGPIETRTEYDESGGVLSRAQLAYDPSGLPQRVVVTDAKNRVLAEFNYDLKVRAEPFPESTFAFDFAPGQIVEDVSLKAAKEYSGPDASDQFHRGLALWRQAEEWPLALAAWDEAARRAPAATAPHFVIYDAAMRARDLNRAEKALEKLAALLGNENFEVAWQRTGLLLERRDWAGAQTALEAAAKIQPQNLQARLSLADVQRSRGDFNGAQAALLEILKSDAPQSATQAQAAQMLAELASGPAAEGVLAATPADTLWQKLARFLIELRRQPSDPDKAAGNAAFATDNLDALQILAREYERAGREEDAIVTWQKIAARASSPADRIAHQHLMAIFARKGETAPSLAHYRELIASAPDLKTQRLFQQQLISAWRKALHQEQLKAALQQRALATNATSDDLRLWLAYQENFGTSQEIESAIAGGLARFSRAAWWRARQSELVAEELAAVLDSNTRDQVQRDALRTIEDAITLDPAQPYYAIQRALILTQRATPVTGVLDPRRYEPMRKAANEALDQLLQKWPDDPDIQIAVASQRLALEADGAHADSIALLQTALREGAAGDELSGAGEDRHFIAFASRQVLISALRRDKKWSELSPQYEILFRTARSGQEQLGAALNYFKLLMSRDEADALAAALLLFARESWPFEESQQVLQPLINVTAARTEILTPLMIALQKSPDPYARLVLAYFASNEARARRQVLASPDPPDSAERYANAAAKNLAAALKELEPVVEGGDKILASRAAALLGEDAINRNAPDEAVKWLERAVALEPRDGNLRAALATAFLVQNQPEEALRVRNEMLRALPHSFGVLHQAAKLSSRLAAPADRETAAHLANQAFNIGQIAPEVSPGSWQLAAYTAARATLDAGKAGTAIAIYNGLASPQWSLVERAVALIDWEESLRLTQREDQASKIAAQLNALGLTPQQRAQAESTWALLIQS